MVVGCGIGSLGEGISRGESVVLAVEIGQTGRDLYALSIEPRAVSDSIARMYRSLPSCWRRTEIGTPNAFAVTRSACEFLAVRVCTS
jgi:hypothetical protein